MYKKENFVFFNATIITNFIILSIMILMDKHYIGCNFTDKVQIFILIGISNEKHSYNDIIFSFCLCHIDES